MRNFTIRAGDTAPVYVTVLDLAGDPINLTGVSARWQAARGTTARFSSTPALIKSTDSGDIVITEAALGELRIILLPEDTENLVGDFYHELELTDSSGSATTPLSGLMSVTRQLIRAA
jgi:hypothetical protein